MLKNAYLGAKIGFDTQKNELSDVGCAASYQLYLYLLSDTQDAVEELPTLAELQHDVVALAVLVAVVDAADVRVVQGELKRDLPEFPERYKSRWLIPDRRGGQI